MKQQKGITLIALVITIIVLLILAGVTIAMLTGSDSAPAKANEAKQKQDIGAAKDQVYIVSSSAQADAYEQIYVKGKNASGTADVKAGTAGAGTEVGTYVKNTVKNYAFTPVGTATISHSTAGTVTIYTTDYTVTGTISDVGGALTWGEITQKTN